MDLRSSLVLLESQGKLFYGLIRSLSEDFALLSSSGFLCLKLLFVKLAGARKRQKIGLDPLEEGL